MTYRRAYLLAILSAAFMVAAILLAGSLASEAVAAQPACHDDRAACEGKPTCAAEDMPCWTWSIHGNMRRGVILKSRRYAGGYFAVVGVCRFQRLYHAKRIDWERTDRLRGDWTALHSFDCD